MRSSRTVSDARLHKLVRRLRPKADAVIISAGGDAGDPTVSSGRVLQRAGGRVSALVDKAVDRNCEIIVFLPDDVYLGEVVSCEATSLLIQRPPAA
jgi:hypothetical protein